MMPMPKASIHKDTCTIFLQHQIRMPRQSWRIKPISESPTPQPFPHNHLNLRILRMDRSHRLVDLCRREFFHITSMLQSIHPSNNIHHRRVYTSVQAPASQGYRPVLSFLALQTILPQYEHFFHTVAPTHKHHKTS